MDQEITAKIVAWILGTLPHLVAAAALVVAGFWLAGAVQRMLLRMMDRQLAVDVMLRGVLAAVVRYGVLILFLVAAVSQLGFEISSVLALLATAGLAVGLALQATLANIAAGVMLLWLRPFRVGDLIEVGGLAGRVVEVGLFACELHTADGVYQFVPNSELWNKRLSNYSRLAKRQVAVRLKLADASRLPALRQWLAGHAPAEPHWLAEPLPDIVISDIADDKITATVRLWTTTEHYAEVAGSLSDRLAKFVSVRPDQHEP